MTGVRCRQVELRSLPDGDVSAADFTVVEADVADPGPGQVTVRLRWLGLNAGLAHRIGGEATSYGPAIGIGDVPASDGIVEVVDSQSNAFEPGDLAVCVGPWATMHVCDASHLRPISPLESGAPLETYLTVLGHTGFTAYTGMIHFGKVDHDDVVYVSAAAGGVGSCAVQFAKARGATVFGCAGSVEKVSLIVDALGADGAVNRHDGSALELLQGLAPDGITLYYDNVGGEQLEAALERLQGGGRVVVCGFVSQGTHQHGLSDFRHLILSELTMRGFDVTNHEDLRDEFETTVSRWLHNGTVRSVHTTFHGIDSVPTAFESLLNGSNSGRTLVSLDDQRRD